MAATGAKLRQVFVSLSILSTVSLSLAQVAQATPPPAPRAQAQAQLQTRTCEAIAVRKDATSAIARANSWLRLKYCYHFEICDHPALPEPVRSAIFTSLGTVTRLFSGIRNIYAESTRSLLARTGAGTIIELGSGGGQGLIELAKGLRGRELKLVATDLVPQTESWRREFRHYPSIRYVDTPVSFQRFASELKDVSLRGNILAVVSAFHHVTNAEARAFFESAVREGAHVLIVEPLERDYKSVLLSLGATVPAMLSPVIAKDLTWRQRLELAVFNWIVPIVPMSFLHDGVVSTLRQRTIEEWRVILDGLPVHIEYQRGLGPFRNFTVLKVVNLKAK